MKYFYWGLGVLQFVLGCYFFLIDNDLTLALAVWALGVGAFNQYQIYRLGERVDILSQNNLKMVDVLQKIQEYDNSFAEKIRKHL
jgi:hypothetical protein